MKKCVNSKYSSIHIQQLDMCIRFLCNIHFKRLATSIPSPLNQIKVIPMLFTYLLCMRITFEWRKKIVQQLNCYSHPFQIYWKISLYDRAQPFWERQREREMHAEWWQKGTDSAKKRGREMVREQRQMKEDWVFQMEKENSNNGISRHCFKLSSHGVCLSYSATV